MTPQAIIPDDVRTEIAAVNTFLSGVPTKIETDSALQVAATRLRDITTKAKDLEARRMEITRPIDAANKSVIDLFAPPLEMLKNAERFLKSEIGRYQLDQQRRRDEEERRLREQAERERREAEGRAASLREKAEAEAEAGRDGRAAYLEGLADQQQEKSATIVTPILAGPAKADGISMRDNWSAEITDFGALIRAVADGAVPIHVLQADMTVLNGLARSLKQGLNYPGVRAVNNPTVAARRI